MDGCSKCAQGSTKFCIAHGGGRRCTFEGCTKGARDKFYCAAHGGGRRCATDGCTKSAVGGTNLCTFHGGGKKCQFEGCAKSAQSPTQFCVRHGGGKKCVIKGCQKVARGRTSLCASHGGGNRCKFENCISSCLAKETYCSKHKNAADQTYEKFMKAKFGEFCYPVPVYHMDPTIGIPNMYSQPYICAGCVNGTCMLTATDPLQMMLMRQKMYASQLHPKGMELYQQPQFKEIGDDLSFRNSFGFPMGSIQSMKSSDYDNSNLVHAAYLNQMVNAFPFYYQQREAQKMAMNYIDQPESVRRIDELAVNGEKVFERYHDSSVSEESKLSPSQYRLEKMVKEQEPLDSMMVSSLLLLKKRKLEVS